MTKAELERIINAHEELAHIKCRDYHSSNAYPNYDFARLLYTLMKDDETYPSVQTAHLMGYATSTMRRILGSDKEADISTVNAFLNKYCRGGSFNPTKAIKLQEIPNVCGLYMVGSTYFNPHTDEKLYYIKVGMSTNLRRRLKEYYTHNALIWIADIIETEDVYLNEYRCQSRLESDYNGQIAENTSEWFKVTREQYLSLCEQGFRHYLFKDIKF